MKYLLCLLLLLVSTTCHAVGKTPIWGEFGVADATAATLTETTARIALYEMVAGAPVAVVVGANDTVEISDVIVAYPSGTGTAASVTIYSGVDDTIDAGEQLFRAICILGGVNTVRINYAGEVRAIRGTYPKVEGQITGVIAVFIKGYIIR